MSSPTHFIRRIIEEEGRPRVVTRFPPEPNGYLHIGHAKSACLNFGLAADYNGSCSLRFDDTNPCRENTEYVRAIEDDLRWLGFDWGEHPCHASHYFDALYEFALELIRNNNAYVCSLSPSQLREYRGTPTTPGRNSPGRERSVEDNLALFEGMREGRYRDGEHILRARIDMASPNLNMRDPTLYRIRHARHHHTGERWPIYPTYDFTHCLSDALEGVTHSLCTLEFEDHRPLYDWVLEHVSAPCHPRQIEFSRLSLEHTVLSKRLLSRLVEEQHLSGWDDPRMPTLRGLRRRGYTAAAIRDFCERIGVTRSDNRIEMAVLENCLRQDLEQTAPRRMAVLDPLKVVIQNYPEGREENFDAPDHPAHPSLNIRQLPFCRELYIERGDFMEEPPSKFFRLAPGREVRLRHACYITCREVIHDEHGNVVELRCTWDPESRGGTSEDRRKVKGTLHWVSARHGIPATVRLYDRLFTDPDPTAGDDDFTASLNPESLHTLTRCVLEPALAEAVPDRCVQFERLGYFCPDLIESTPQKPLFNRAVTLRDTWSKQTKVGGGKAQ